MLSYFSPLLKSIAGRGVGIYYAIIEEDVAEQEAFIEALESRFLFLAADARSTIRVLKLHLVSNNRLKQWKGLALATLKLRPAEVQSMILKGGGMCA
ncbi:hypothetical protein GH714_024886 [Hevea brasiliensis]|uniref:Uncharacterized protein n=1 Tax=Hevea brasiliensis TaxID=3981 RepID=A0A6A6MWV4_HEVBR|nr:hypothetical protein GH714_024886 [Hevea brasiliensis]